MKGNLFILILFLVGVLSACQEKVSNEMIEFGPHLKVPIVFFFKKGTSQEQINHFLHNIIGYPAPEGRGTHMMKGISAQFSVRNQDYEGYALDRIDEAERQNILRVINSSPLIYKVFENAVPKEIILDAAKAKKEKEELEQLKKDNRPPKEVIEIKPGEHK